MINKNLEFTFGELKIFIEPLLMCDNYCFVKIENKYRTDTYDLPKQYVKVLINIISNLME